jgi:hypothetical protein
MFFFCHPCLKTTFQDAPLAADFERWDLPMLNHSMQRSFRNFQYAGSLG